MLSPPVPPASSQAQPTKTTAPRRYYSQLEVRILLSTTFFLSSQGSSTALTSAFGAFSSGLRDSSVSFSCFANCQYQHLSRQIVGSIDEYTIATLPSH